MSIIDEKKVKDYMNSITGKFDNIPIYKIQAHKRAITSVKITPDNTKLITASKDNELKLWNISDGSKIGNFEGHEGAISCCDVDLSSNFLITGSFDCSIKKWNIFNRKLIYSESFKSVIESVSFGNIIEDERFCVVVGNLLGQTSKIVINDKEYVSEDKKVIIKKAIFNKDNSLIYACDTKGYVIILDVNNDLTCIRKTCIHPNYKCLNIRFDKSNFKTLITSSNDNSSKLLDPRNLNIIKNYVNKYPIHDSIVFNEYVIHTGGTEVSNVTTSDNSRFDITFYSKRFQDKLGAYCTHFGTVISLDISANNKYLCSGSSDGIVAYIIIPDKLQLSYIQ